MKRFFSALAVVAILCPILADAAPRVRHSAAPRAHPARRHAAPRRAAFTLRPQYAPPPYSRSRVAQPSTAHPVFPNRDPPAAPAPLPTPEIALPPHVPGTPPPALAPRL